MSKPAITIDVATVLDGIVTFIKRYVVLSEEAATVLALWVIHTHAIEAAHFTPYMLIKSPTKRCGKSRLLDVLGLLVARPLSAANVTVAALFRSIGENAVPTILLDEQDNLADEELRKILNAGFERGRPVRRCVGNSHTPVEFPVFCPKVLASIGKLPDTVTDRAFVIELKRKAGDEEIEAFRLREVEPLAGQLRQGAAAWVAENETQLAAATPTLPDELDDRARDIVEPLAAIADLAGGRWPEEARTASVALRPGVEDDGDLRTELLGDIQRSFGAITGDFIRTEELLRALTDDPASRWSEWRRGAPMTARGLAHQLEPFGICPQMRQVAGRQARGYSLGHFDDVFRRYLGIASTPSTASTPDATSAGVASSFPKRADL